MLPVLWFWIVAVMIAMYVVLDGFDLGAGAVHLAVAKTDEERRMVLRSIGPVWDGNEVWLLAGGGVLYFAFPALYASSFSGFYLPLMVVLWLLILRGISIEFRSHIRNAVWRPMWDVIFGGASALLAVFFDENPQGSCSFLSGGLNVLGRDLLVQLVSPDLREPDRRKHVESIHNPAHLRLPVNRLQNSPGCARCDKVIRNTFDLHLWSIERSVIAPDFELDSVSHGTSFQTVRTSGSYVSTSSQRPHWGW